MSRVPVIELIDVSKSYRKGGETLVVLDNLSLEIAEGEFVAMMGPSGSGKSTILNLIGGLDVPDSGRVIVADTTLTGLSVDELATFRARHIAYMFQAFNLIPVLNALENVELPLLLTPLSKADRRKQAKFALDIVGLADRMDHRPKQLSGGQEQRVAIARAIAMDPDVLLCDEPTGDLDRESADQVLELLQRLANEYNKTIVMVTHDEGATEFATRTIRLDKAGRIGAGA